MATLATILVIDDEVRSQESLRRTLEEDFTVRTASSAKEGREIMERETVQVVLCDQRMPEMTGVEFLKEVRERWPDTVRIIISGYTETQDIIAGVNEAGIYQYVMKPWHPESLLLTVRAAAQLYDLQQQTQNMDLELRTTEPVLRRRVETKREKLRDYFEFSRESIWLHVWQAATSRCISRENRAPAKNCSGVPFIIPVRVPGAHL